MGGGRGKKKAAGGRKKNVVGDWRFEFREL